MDHGRHRRGFAVGVFEVIGFDARHGVPTALKLNVMSGYNDPYSGFFGEPGHLNWPVLLWCAFAGIIALVMFLIFMGFDSGGFLHRLDERLKIRNVDRNPVDEEHSS